MRIKEVRLKDFKRFTDLTIQLGDDPKKIIALVGPNGCGKSSVFDAFLEKSRDYRRTKAQPGDHYYSKKWYSADPDRKSESYSKRDSIIIKKVDGNEDFNKKSFYVRSSYRFTPRLNIEMIKSLAEISEDLESPDSAISTDIRLQENYERLLGNFFTDVYDKEITGTDWVRRNTENVNNILQKIVNIKISYLGNPTKKKAQLYFEKEGSKDFPYENLSSGEKEVVDIVVDLLIKKDEFNDTVYCIDEPELHLNTAIQRNLLNEIEKLIPDTCQLWVATHSVGFLRALQEDLKEKSQILDFSEKDYFERPETIFPIKTTRKNWQRIFKTALEDITGLMAPNRIIYCEGKPEPNSSGEEDGLDALVYNQVFEDEFDDSLFISSGGDDTEINVSIALKIISKAFSGVKILHLKDKDENSEQAREIFLSKSSINRMLLRRSVENYLFDKEIIEKYCQAKKIAFNESSYNQTVSDINEQNLKQVQQQLQSLSGDHGKINDFKLELAKLITDDTHIYKELKECVFNDGVKK